MYHQTEILCVLQMLLQMKNYYGLHQKLITKMSFLIFVLNEYFLIDFCAEA